MAFSDAAMQIGANAIRTSITHAQLHSAASANGTTNLQGGRFAVSFSNAATADGDFSLPAPVQVTGLAANGAVTHVSLWTASSGGTHLGTFALTGDNTANAAGEYTFQSFTVNGSTT